MGNPFSASKPEVSKPRPQEVNPDETPKLKCKKCKSAIVRSVLGTNEWVHEDDKIIFPANIDIDFSFTQYDHEAIPDYLEVTSRDITPT